MVNAIPSCTCNTDVMLVAEFEYKEPKQSLDFMFYNQSSSAVFFYSEAVCAISSRPSKKVTTIIQFNCLLSFSFNLW